MLAKRLRQRPLAAGSGSGGSANPRLVWLACALCLAATAFLYLFAADVHRRDMRSALEQQQQQQEQQQQQHRTPKQIWTAAAEVEAAWGSAGGIIRVRIN